jgi:hypothetical protein
MLLDRRTTPANLFTGQIENLLASVFGPVVNFADCVDVFKAIRSVVDRFIAGGIQSS